MRNFLKQLLATLIGSFLGLILFSIVGTGSLVALLFLVGTRTQQPQIASNSILVIDISKPIQDHTPPLSFAESFLEEEVRPLTLQKVVSSLEKATAPVGKFMLEPARTTAPKTTKTTADIVAVK